MNHLISGHFILLLLIVLVLGVTHPFKKFRLAEKLVTNVMMLNGLVSLVLCIAGLITMGNPIEYHLFSLIHLSFDGPTFGIYLFMVILLAATSHFSFRYIHKEIGFHKFFLNIALFWTGLFLFNFSADHLVLFAGWELIGISSVFLIGYYHYRRNPVIGSLYVVNFYKFADIILITSLLFIKHGHHVALDGNLEQYIYLGIVVAGLIKSASFPFTSWLPRAMEGPTPSSAVYYAALSLNTGVLLIYKMLPDILSHDVARNGLLIAGILTTVYSSIQSRVQNDIKSSLAYSTSVQIGLVLIELSLGYSILALVHMFSSSVLKIYQFIRTPSLLRIYHSMEGDNGRPFGTSGVHFEFLLPAFVRKFFYYLSINHFYLDLIYGWLAWGARMIGNLAKLLLYPVVGNKGEVKYRSLLWGGYYILTVVLLFIGAIEIQPIYFDIIPAAILFIGLAILFERNINSFIALFAIYKILESVIVHSVHSHDPYKALSIFLAGVFSISLVMVCKRRMETGVVNDLFSSLAVFMMLFFTNFPFLLQSLVNEHIIEAMIESGSLANLIMYSLANTFLNLGLYSFVFDKVYLAEAIDG